MKPEQRTWATLRLAMGDRWHATRHEDAIATGYSDVSFGAEDVQGWIELKRLLKLPKRPTTPVRVPHLTADQRLFLRERGRYGGHCFLLLHAADTWLLFDHESPQVLTDGLATGKFCLSILERDACFICRGKIDPDGLLEVLTQ